MEKTEKDIKRLSKFLSLVLRHRPEQIGLSLDEQGWAAVEELIKRMNEHDIAIDAHSLDTIVVTNSKQRFAYDYSKTRIRANQGHSINVDLQLQDLEPPELLYHGTTINNIEAILKEGLKKQQRQLVHLSADIETAKAVGSRHGKPVVITVKAKEMYEAGYKFFLSENKVWLTNEVPVQFLSVE